jgi:flagellar hook-basal body complex protein FliE
MDPLSALRTMVSPVLRGAPASPVAAPPGPVRIPAAELDQVGHGQQVGVVGRTARLPSFEDALGQFVGEVNARQATAQNTLNGLLSGQDVSLHQAMIAMEEASVSFQLMVEVRNKLLESYQELMRMQV